jgi:hypothetical protein|tara:strand:+ start:3257 stop:3712 length:456 start_codon:yes stop_codon:yes gene_type:complete
MIYKCENNYLDNKQNISLKETLKQKNFPWFIENELFLKHTFIYNSEMISDFCYLLDPFTKKIKNKILNASCYFFLKGKKTNRVKIDNNIKDNFLCLIHYLNSSDGSVEINNIDKIPNTLNRAVLFDNNVKVTYNTPIKENQFFIEILFNKF